MGIDKDFSNAYAKAAIAAGLRLPESGKVFITMIDKFKDQIVPVAKQLKVRQLPHSSVLAPLFLKLPRIMHADMPLQSMYCLCFVSLMM